MNWPSKGVTIEEGHLMKDHVHMSINIPPKYSVFNVVGYLKENSTISIAKKFRERQRNFNGEDFGLKVILSPQWG